MASIDWYKKYGTYVRAILLTSGALGFIGGASCLLFPSLLFFLASIPLLAFLPFLHVVVSSLLVGVITGCSSFTIMAISAALIRQALLISKHVSALFISKLQTEELLPASNSHVLMQPYLQQRTFRYKKEADLEEEEDVSMVIPVMQTENTPLKPVIAEQPVLNVSMTTLGSS